MEMCVLIVAWHKPYVYHNSLIPRAQSLLRMRVGAAIAAQGIALADEDG